MGAHWYPFLDKLMRTRFAHLAEGSFKYVATKVLAEQIVLGPLCTFAFFPCVSIVEGGDSLKSLGDRMKRDYWPTLVVSTSLGEGDFQHKNRHG